MNITLKLLSLLTAVLLLGCSMQDANVHVDPKAKEAGPIITSVKPGILKSYSAFFLTPIIIYGNDEGRLMPASSMEMDRLEAKFKSKLIAALGSHYTQFNQPAKGVAIIDIKITNVWSNRALEALRPGIIFPNNLGAGATMQADFYDSITHQKIASVWDSRAGQRQGFLSGLGKWAGVEVAFDEWARLLKQGIQQGSY